MAMNERTQEPQQRPKNARFWAYAHGSPCSITLRPGQKLWHAEGGPTEQGFRYEHTTWIHQGDHVVRVHNCFARDCDGVCEWYREDASTLNMLARHPWHRRHGRRDENGKPIRGPRWQEVDSSQRDCTAEAMGY